jgi:hypothetical protein
MQERIELRFSPGNPKERALIDALNAQDDGYGVKGRFLKERLLKGYRIVLTQVERLLQESDPMAALDRFSSSVDSKHYRVLKIMMANRDSEGRIVQPRAVRVVREVPPVVVAAEPQVVPALPQQLAVVSQTPQPGLEEAPKSAVVISAEMTVDVPAKDGLITKDEPVLVESVVVAPTVVPRKHDWSSFKGIAGVKREG